MRGTHLAHAANLGSRINLEQSRSVAECGRGDRQGLRNASLTPHRRTPLARAVGWLHDASCPPGPRPARSETPCVDGGAIRASRSGAMTGFPAPDPAAAAWHGPVRHPAGAVSWTRRTWVSPSAPTAAGRGPACPRRVGSRSPGTPPSASRTGPNSTPRPPRSPERRPGRTPQAQHLPRLLRSVVPGRRRAAVHQQLPPRTQRLPGCLREARLDSLRRGDADLLRLVQSALPHQEPTLLVHGGGRKPLSSTDTAS